MPLAALIWDVDGTLAETEEAHRRAFNRTFREHGYGWEWSRGKYCDLLRVAGGVERITHFLRTDCSGEIPAAKLASTARELHKAKTADYVRSLESGEVPLRPGVERLMIEAREAGVRLAIATTTSAPNIEALLGQSPGAVRLDWFEVIGAGGVVQHKKPAPDIYDWTLKRLGLPPPHCVAMEDSRNGLMSAAAAGLEAVITYSSYTDGEDFTGALAVTDSLGEPEAPMTVLAGDANGQPCIDLALIRGWHAAATGG